MPRIYEGPTDYQLRQHVHARKHHRQRRYQQASDADVGETSADGGEEEEKGRTAAERSAADAAAGSAGGRSGHAPACGPRWWRRVPIPSFKNDADRRDFIAMGAAAAMAAMFGAPIAGTLYVHVEG